MASASSSLISNSAKLNSLKSPEWYIALNLKGTPMSLANFSILLPISFITL
uniref:Uncharacterized protein n=1 Tax=Rhizophora mucronata TaxID=61149 RepID=A0A2P2JPA8_RHIMU